MLRFLSCWSWVEQKSIRVDNWTQGSHQFRAKRPDAINVVSSWPLDFDYWPKDLSKNAELSLAFYREGLNLSNAPYSFLSFYKILDIIESGNNGQRKLLKKYVGKIEDRFAKDRLSELGGNPDNRTIEDYIYQSGRLAVAHAYAKRSYSVDPDNPEHDLRLRKDLPIMREIAKQVIVGECGLLTKEQVWESKTHFVSGAIWAIGKTTYEKILKEGTIGRRSVILPKRVDIRVRAKDKFETLENLLLKVRAVHSRVIYVTAASDDGGLELSLEIDLERGRLVFDPLVEHQCLDGGTANCAKRIAEFNSFWGQIIGNGRCQIVETATQFVIAEAQAYMPTNFFLNHENHNKLTNEWKDISEARKTAESQTR